MMNVMNVGKCSTDNNFVFSKLCTVSTCLIKLLKLLNHCLSECSLFKSKTDKNWQVDTYDAWHMTPGVRHIISQNYFCTINEFFSSGLRPRPIQEFWATLCPDRWSDSRLMNFSKSEKIFDVLCSMFILFLGELMMWGNFTVNKTEGLNYWML